jgi:hypothetical protein
MDSTARLPPQSPVLFPDHRDLRRNGDFLGGGSKAAKAGTGQWLLSAAAALAFGALIGWFLREASRIPWPKQPKWQTGWPWAI